VEIGGRLDGSTCIQPSGLTRGHQGCKHARARCSSRYVRGWKKRAACMLQVRGTTGSSGCTSRQRRGEPCACFRGVALRWPGREVGNLDGFRLFRGRAGAKDRMNVELWKWGRSGNHMILARPPAPGLHHRALSQLPLLNRPLSSLSPAQHDYCNLGLLLNSTANTFSSRFTALHQFKS